MAFSKINNVSIRGISACVPRKIEENISLPILDPEDAPRIIAQTGIERRHIVDTGQTVVDLCAEAFRALMNDLSWESDSLDALVLVSSAGDYITPPSSNVLHGILGLPETCLCFDIRQGCPGWVVGMEVLSSMMQTGNFRRAILLCGDSSTIMKSPFDKETRPLFGDAGTATALEYDESAPAMEFEHGCRGKDFQVIMAHDGGLRFPVNEDSLRFVEQSSGRKVRGVDCVMNGMDVFSFALSAAPRSIMALADHFGINLESIDCFLFHQANFYLNEKIRKKLRISPEKVPYSLRDYGNTGPATIPLTLLSERRAEYSSGRMETVACGFGVGLAWGSIHFVTDRIVCHRIIESGESQKTSC